MNPDDDPHDDEVPIADAVEQQRDVRTPAPDDESLDWPGDSPPLETAAVDWQQQHQEVDLDPELEESRED
jgi:hypothetical protein